MQVHVHVVELIISKFIDTVFCVPSLIKKCLRFVNVNLIQFLPILNMCLAHFVSQVEVSKALRVCPLTTENYQWF